MIDASAVSAATVTRTLDLRADGTTSSGFTITGNGNDVGISISGQGVTASGNTINNVLTGVQTTTQYTTGNAIISGNTIDSQYGISLQNAGDTVSDNHVTASVEGVGLINSANSSFSGNTFTIGASGNALDYYGSASSADLTNSGNTVNIAGGGVQGAVDLAGTDGAVNLAAGTYTMPGVLAISNSGLTLTGADQATTILNSSAGLGIDVTADDTTLSGFTLNMSTNAGGIGANLGGASIFQNFYLHDVTVNAAGLESAVDVAFSNNTRIDFVTTQGHPVVGFEIDNFHQRHDDQQRGGQFSDGSPARPGSVCAANG